MRVTLLVAVMPVLFSPGWAQDVEQSLLERIDRVIREETERARRELLDLVRRELAGAGAGTVEAANGRVTAGLLREHVEYLASDGLEGRNAGYPGNDKAAEYIADEMKKVGLGPAGDGGTYFQKFKVAGRETRNCLGVLEGSDPELRKEYVVVGAHHDHVGTADQGHWGRLGKAKGEDRIWNGADDNASGTSAVLGIARAFAEGRLRTKRSVLFMTFSGEEGGLLGSIHYTRHPLAPMDRHVFMMNLDMVGRNPDRPMEIHGVGSAEGEVLRKVVEEGVDQAGLRAKLHDKVELLGGDSDHSSFRAKRVPFVFFFSGFHADYHRVTDHADKLAYDNIAKVAHAATHILFQVANANERPKFSRRAGEGLDLPGLDLEDPPKPARRMGVTVQELDDEECDALGLGKEQGGLRVDGVHAKGVAEAAGMKDGDVLLSLDGVTLPRGETRAKLRDVLGDKVASGKDVPVVVLRDGERTTLQARWPD
jgi:acetylornithine deacetylase/succinyl-diaminopimelate desuccinylase-like protein